MPDNNLDLTGQVDNILPDTQHISLWQKHYVYDCKASFYKNIFEIVTYSATEKDCRH